MSVDNVTAAAVAMQSGSTQQQMGVALVKQSLDAEKSVLQLMTVATDGMKGQAVNIQV